MKKLWMIISSRAMAFLIVIVLQTIGFFAFILFFREYFLYLWIFSACIWIPIFLFCMKTKMNPDFKAAWLCWIVFFAPFGAILYAVFLKTYSQKETKYLKAFLNKQKQNLEGLQSFEAMDRKAYNMAYALCREANTMVYTRTKSKYYGDVLLFYRDLLDSLNRASNFIFMEYFAIATGEMWRGIEEILQRKAQAGVLVRVIYDDIGSMKLPLGFDKRLEKLGINCRRFSMKPIGASSINRDHRKITVIDGSIAFTGGINFSDEYIRTTEKFGNWKDCAVKFEGEAVKGITELFLNMWDYAEVQLSNHEPFLQINKEVDSFDGYYLPFGDGPAPLYKTNISKNAIMEIINQANYNVYITSPYLIVDNEVMNSICHAARRGIDVRIITPQIPDRKILQLLTRSTYQRLLASGVKIFEYTAGFIHQKTIISDDQYAITGTINLDYRSLYHFYENAVWMYKTMTIVKMKEDFIKTVEKYGKTIEQKELKTGFFGSMLVAIAKLFAPIL